MGLVTQYSRLLHHTITGASGSTFSVPSSEDFTDGSWTAYDLNLSEIGVNETDQKAYIRIGSGIKEFQFTGTGSGTTIYADNGLTLTGATISLGGTLTQVNTTINGNSQSFILGTAPSRLKSFIVDSYQGVSITDDDGLIISNLTIGGGYSKFDSSEVSTGASSIVSAGAYGKSYFEVTPNGADIFKIELDSESVDKKMLVTDTVNSKGLEYAADYTAAFITHSLVTKAYVDSQVSNATQSLSEVLADGNSTGTFSIVMGTASVIESSGGLSNISVINKEVRISTSYMVHADGTASAPTFYENKQITTSTASTASLFIFTGSTLTADAAVSFDAIVNGFNPVTGDSYFSKVFSGFRSISSTITQIGITNITELSTFTSSVTSNFTTDATDVFLDVTGESGQTINWTVRINYQYTY